MFGLTEKISQAIAIGLGALLALALIVIGIQHHTLEQRQDKIDKLIRSGGELVMASKVTAASLNQCLATNAGLAKQSDDRARSYADSKLADAKDVALADKRATEDRQRTETLRGIATQRERSCDAPSALISSLKGL